VNSALVSDLTISDWDARPSKEVECIAQTSLLRPEGLVRSPAFSHVAVVHRLVIVLNTKGKPFVPVRSVGMLM
jgi:hypothetical protein